MCIDVSWGDYAKSSEKYEDEEGKEHSKTVAAELTRRKMPDKYGKEPISIGFWVGGSVTPNKFEEFIEKPEYPYAARSARNKVFKQLLTCPFCGKPLKEEKEINVPVLVMSQLSRAIEQRHDKHPMLSDSSYDCYSNRQHYKR